MKRLCVTILASLLCLSMSACSTLLQTGGNGNTPNNSTIDPLKAPEIVLDPNDVRQENRYDENGNHVGYFRYTNGTNCGVHGCMLIEFTDLEGNVLNSYSPKFAGCFIGGGCHGYWPHGQFEITDIGEGNGKRQDPDNINNNNYQVYPCSGGKIYSYIETRGSRTTLCELYDRNGKVIASLAPLDPKNQLSIENIFVFFEEEWEGYQDHFMISEHSRTTNEDGQTVRTGVRDIFYSTTGEFLADYRYTTEGRYHGSPHVRRIEAASQNGEVIRVFEPSVENAFLGIGYDARFDSMRFYEVLDDMGTIRQEIITLGTYETIFKEAKIYHKDGSFSHVEMELYGRKVNVTYHPEQNRYTKLEFFDAEGNLHKTVEAPAGGSLSFRWVDALEFRIYNSNGEEVGWETYNPLQ